MLKALVKIKNLIKFVGTSKTSQLSESHTQNSSQITSTRFVSNCSIKEFVDENYEIEDKISELRFKRKKIFGTKVKKCEWKTKNLLSSSEKEKEVDIINYLKRTKNFDFKDLRNRFNINPSKEEEAILENIVGKNPMINIRRRDKDFLLRVNIRKINYSAKFRNIKNAMELRNILLLYSMINDPRYILHLSKRNKI